MSPQQRYLLWKAIPHYLACQEIQYRNANSELTEKRISALAIAATENEDEADDVWARSVLELLKQGRELQ